MYLDLAGGSYARPETGGLTLTGSLTDDETEHPMDADLLGSEAGFDEASAVLARTARAIPTLADSRFSHGYAGAFDITPGLDADPRRVAAARPLRGGRDVGARLQAGARGGRDDGGPRHGRAARR